MNSLLVKRPLAYFIDFMIICSACILPQLISFWLFNGVPFKSFTQPYHVYLWVLLTVSLPVWLYFILQEMSIKQSTIGKRIMHVKVTDKDNLRISKEKSFTRTFIKLLPWEISHAALLPIYFSKDPQLNIGLYVANGFILVFIIYFIVKKGKTAIHDVLPNTRVVLDR